MRLLAISSLALALTAAPAGLFAQQLPADTGTAVARLNASPRHGEWVMVSAGGSDSVRTWVVYPERRSRAPVVIVIHEIFGLTDWVRGVADQLAAEGFIAIAPDLLSGKGPNGAGSTADLQANVALIRTLVPADIARRLNAEARYGRSLPAASGTVGTVGFCWGGGVSFQMAGLLEGSAGHVVYYGVSPDSATLAAVHAPVLGLYAGEDARVDATIPAARTSLDAQHKRYETAVYDGAGHGFLRDLAGRNGANQHAAEQAWPRTIAFFRETLGR